MSTEGRGRSKGFGDKENSRGGPLGFKDLKEGQSGWSHREQRGDWCEMYSRVIAYRKQEREEPERE